MKLISILLLIVFCGSCHTKQGPKNRKQEILRYLNYIKTNYKDKALAMMYVDPYVKNYQATLLFDLANTAEILKKYEIPPSDKWSMEYDTFSIVKLEKYIIPINVTDTADQLEEAYMTILFEYGGSHIGDSIYAYSLFAKNKHKGMYGQEQ